MLSNSLSRLECHFNWKLIQDPSNEKLSSILGNLSVDIKMNPDIEVQSLLYIAFLTVSLKKDYDEALSILQTVLTEKLYSPEHADHFIGFKSVALANKAFTMQKKGEDDDTIGLVLNEIESLQKSMSDTHLAAIYATRGYALIMLDRDRYEESLQCYQQAYRLQRDYFGWPLCIGITLGRLRRIFENSRMLPTEIEEESIEKAIDLSQGKKPLPLVFMADLLFAKGRRTGNLEENPELNSQARRFYDRAYDLAPDSSHVLKRYGKALSVWRENDLALKILLQCASIDPQNSICQHRLGAVYEHGLQEFAKARECYEKAIDLKLNRNLLAELDLIRCEKRLDQNFDCFKRFELMKTFYRDDFDLAKIDAAIDKQRQYEERQKLRNSARNGFRRGGPSNNRGNSRLYATSGYYGQNRGGGGGGRNFVLGNALKKF